MIIFQSTDLRTTAKEERKLRPIVTALSVSYLCRSSFRSPFTKNLSWKKFLEKFDENRLKITFGNLKGVHHHKGCGCSKLTWVTPLRLMADSYEFRRFFRVRI